MSNTPDWLPELVCLSDYTGSWDDYLEAIYAFFKQDFVDSRPVFRDKRLGLKKHPLSQGKEATFWHMISDGANEEDRLPDFRRSERIRWVRAIIENEVDPIVKVWWNKRKGKNNICLWFEQENYLVVLADRGEYILPWTAYLVEQPHRKRKLQKEYEAYCKAQKGRGRP